MPSVLLVEDDANLRDALRDNLVDEDYEVDAASTVAQANALLDLKSFDLLVLDVMLPDGDGYSIARRLQQRGTASRVLMLTARSLEEDVVRGFDEGADDYLAKPYRLKELLARVAALLRRKGPGAPASSKQIHFGAFVLDPDTRQVTGPSGPLTMTRTEFDLLALLLKAGDRVLSRDEILDAVWGKEVVVDAHTVDNFVSSLKKKLKAGARDFEVQTVRGIGFRFVRHA